MKKSLLVFLSALIIIGIGMIGCGSNNSINPINKTQTLIAPDSNTVFYVLYSDSTVNVISTSNNVTIVLPDNNNVEMIIAGWKDHITGEFKYQDTLYTFGGTWIPCSNN